MTEAVIVDGLRTPIGRQRGGLSGVRPDDLAARVISALLERQPSAKADVEEVIFGDTNQAGEDNRNVARMASILAGLPFEVSAVTVNRLCGSGLEAVIQAARAIRLGDHECMVAGGVESMSRAPWAMPKPDQAFPRKPPTVYDTSLGWRFTNPKMGELFEMIGMGQTAENVAERSAVIRVDQDAFAYGSHKKALAAWEARRFDDEVVSVTTPPKSRKQPPGTFERDESMRADSTPEKLATLRAVFRDGGSVTAGNSSPLNDGAAALLLTSDTYAKRQGLTPIARVRATGVAGVHPNYMGIGPVPATRRALSKAGLSISDIDLVELNEAFAAQSLACIRELGLDQEKTNVNGGAIALGHPIGCSGARIVVTLLHEMKRRDVTLGLATLCIGVGQGLALIVERV